MHQDNEDRRIAVIPKDTVIHFNGEPCRLVEDTRVVNAYMAKVGFEEYCRMTSQKDSNHQSTTIQASGSLAALHT
jgi:hypothetical protein